MRSILTCILWMAVPNGHESGSIERRGCTQHNSPVGQIDEEEPELARLRIAKSREDDRKEVKTNDPSVDQVPLAVCSVLPLERRRGGHLGVKSCGE